MLFRRILAALGVAGSLAFSAAPAQATGPSPEDAAFLKAAHQTNIAEIAAGRLAWQRTTAPEVKAVAAALMRDHIQLDAKLYQVARNLRIYLPEQTTPEQQSLARGYAAAGNDTFDEYFISTQLAGHRKALRMLKEQAASGDEVAVRRLAEDAVPVVTKHHHLLRVAAEAEGIAGYAGMGGRPTP